MTRDPIDELLDVQAELPDGGFTERVMAALPRPRAASRPLEGWLVALLAGVAAAVLAPDLGGLALALSDGWTGLGGGLARALSWSGATWPATAALLATAAALLAAWVGAWLVSEPG